MPLSSIHCALWLAYFDEEILMRESGMTTTGETTAQKVKS